MLDTQLPPATLEGWYALHQLYRLRWADLDALPADRLEEVGAGMRELLETGPAEDGAGWTGAYRMVGSGAHLMFLHFRTSLEALTDADRTVARSPLAEHLELVRDYVSVVELGLYALTAELAGQAAAQGEEPSPEAWRRAVEAAKAEQRELAYVRRRLYPVQPEGMPYVCFYPMNKRRLPGQNWYELDLAERNRLMHEHGTVGRRYADRISQIISGSVGLDDWEWGVTLFAGDPLDFKEVVTEMRYDRASARYAEFGRFHVGVRLPAEAWSRPGSW